MSDIHAILELEELAMKRNFHRWQHAYFATRPSFNSKHSHIAKGINGAVLRTMVDTIGYSCYSPVADFGKECRECKRLGIII